MKLPESFTKVTPLSKILAGVLFILLSFVGFYLGIKYQQNLTSNSELKPAPIELENLVRENVIITDSAFQIHSGDSYQVQVLVNKDIVSDRNGFVPIGIKMIETNSNKLLKEALLTYQATPNCYHRDDLYKWNVYETETWGSEQLQKGKFGRWYIPDTTKKLSLVIKFNNVEYEIENLGYDNSRCKSAVE